MGTWVDTCAPCIDPDSTETCHQGSYGIPPFQTHSRYFYAPLGEACCGRHFVDLHFQQYHPFPHCRECAQLVLGAASHICWQCRTYFRRYGTGQMQQCVGVTPQRHDILAVRMPERGHHQQRLPKEIRAQQWRDSLIENLRPPILQVLLPQESTCQFWIGVNTLLEQLQNPPYLVHLPVLPMPYFSEEALLPLPPTPQAGFRTNLSLQQEVIDESLQIEHVQVDELPSYE